MPWRLKETSQKKRPAAQTKMWPSTKTGLALPSLKPLAPVGSEPLAAPSPAECRSSAPAAPRAAPGPRTAPGGARTAAWSPRPRTRGPGAAEAPGAARSNPGVGKGGSGGRGASGTRMMLQHGQSRTLKLGFCQRCQRTGGHQSFDSSAVVQLGSGICLARRVTFHACSHTLCLKSSTRRRSKPSKRESLFSLSRASQAHSLSLTGG